ncbi:MAG: HAAS signaling domain-containing protein [Ornithinibacter sp.]
MAPGDDGTDRSEQPAVRAWLARLDTESAGLPEDRRTELRTSVEDYLADVARAAGPDGARATERALADLGSPEALVAEAGGYAVAPAEPFGAEAAADAPTGPPWLEASTLALLAASVVLALVPATEAFAPVPWFVGTLLVLLSRRWSAGDKSLAVLAFGVMGVPFILLGRDELPTSMSLVVSVLLVAGWVAAAARLLVRAQSPREQGVGLRMR